MDKSSMFILLVVIPALHCKSQNVLPKVRIV